MSSEIRRLVRWILTDVSGELTAFIIRVMTQMQTDSLGTAAYMNTKIATELDQ
jgi:hypothetical protein